MHSLWVVGLVLAELLPPASPHLVPHPLIVSGENDQQQELGLAGTPTLLVPIFTRCTGTCPLTAVALNEAMSQMPERFRVVLIPLCHEHFQVCDPVPPTASIAIDAVA